MPARTPDPGIPTLTHRAEPSFHDPADDDADAPLLTELADEAGPVYEHDPFPVLTDEAGQAEPAPPHHARAVVGARSHDAHPAPPERRA
ncbi:hypothetical protein BMR85_005580, partial [Achromobacter sp. KAs 3-5]